MRTIIFDVRGEYALFKKPYSPMSPVSFPFPPPTAVMGMLGAILGYDKDEYHDCLGWMDVRVGVGLKKPLKHHRAAINLLNTKDGTDAFFRPRSGSNTHIQVPFEFIKRPAYRIYVADLAESVADELVRLLASGETVYTPVLGLANCLADVNWVGEFHATLLATETWKADTVVPIHENMRIHYEDKRRYQRLRVPAIMDGNRIVHRYQETVVAEDAGAISGSGGTMYQADSATIAFL